MDARNILKAMKDELKEMREGKKCMEALLVAVRTELQEIRKRILQEYQAMKILADDLLEVIVGGTEVNNENLDDETMKKLLEEASRDFIIIGGTVNGAQSRGSCSPAGGGINNGGERGDDTSDQNLDGTNITVKEAPGTGVNGGRGGQATS